MPPPKTPAKSPGWRGLFDWKVLIISRKALHACIGITFVLFAAALLAAFLWRGHGVTEKAKQAIAAAETAITRAYQAGAEIFAYYQYTQASQELAKARKSFEAGDFKTAYDHAVKAENLARRAEAEIGEQNLVSGRYATVSALSGRVEIKRAKSLSWQLAGPGLRLSSEDQIRTTSNSQIQITFDDSNVLQVKPNSLIVIGDLSEDSNTRARKSSIRLMESEIEAKVRKTSGRGSEFRIETPTAVAETEKANLAIRVTSDRESRIKVFTGKAAVSSGGKVLSLGDNQEVRVTNDYKLISSSVPLSPPPAPIAPTNMKLLAFPNPNQGKVAFAWSDVPGAKGYHLELSQDPFFFDLIMDLKEVATLLYEVERLEAGTYFWRVSSVNSQGSEGGFSEHESFQVKYAAEGMAFRIESLLIMVGQKRNQLSIQGTTEAFASVVINEVTVRADQDGRFRASLDGIPQGNLVLNIRVSGQKGGYATFQREIPVGI